MSIETKTNEELLDAFAGEMAGGWDGEEERAAVLARMIEPEAGDPQEYRAWLAKLCDCLTHGQAIVEWCGCEERFGVERFVAHVVFPLGPPDNLRFNVVWEAKPVRIVLDDVEPAKARKQVGEDRQ